MITCRDSVLPLFSSSSFSSVWSWSCNSGGECSSCGGSLIAPDIVLTTAHCIRDDVIYHTAYVGAYRRESSNSGGQRRNCKRIIKHEEFSTSPRRDNDLALCKLTNPIYIDQSEARLVLNEDDSVPNVGEDLITIGLGRTKNEPAERPDFLMEVSLPYHTNEVCNTAEVYDGDITNTMLCAGPLSGGQGICHGDVGGPIVRINGNVHTLVGVTSWGGHVGDPNCAMANGPSVYTRVSSLMTWIRQTACKDLGSIGSF